MTVGHGRAHGAVTVLNATATGIGCALAIDAGAEAQWAWDADAPGLVLAGAPDDRLARAVHARHATGRRADGGGGGPGAGGPAASRGARVAARTSLPPSRGLKTSSSAAAAMLRAAHAADGAALHDGVLLREAVAAARAAGVTLTGALDDQAAVTLGGCHVTDNRRDEVLHEVPIEPWHVAVWVPDAAVAKAQVAALDAAPAASGAREALALLRAGDVPGALTCNGRAFHALYRAAGLPVDDAPVRVALAHGALGAGLSGTGPAVAALFDVRVPLPAVPGGAWRWTRAVEGPS